MSHQSVGYFGLPHQPCLVVKDLACEKGGRVLFKALSFTLTAGSGLVITGPNGAGKTSLLRIIAGLAQPQQGSICFENHDNETELREHFHFLGNRDGLKAALTAREHCDHWFQFYRARLQAGLTDQRRNDAVVSLLARLFLTRQADVPAGVLSSGQRRRLAFGRLLLAPRPIWLLDEPLNTLDSAMRETFMEPAMASHVQGGGILLVATHIPVKVSGLGGLNFEQDGGIVQT